jgi:hypothetical protein
MSYQTLDPTTQVALFSVCIGNCSTLLNMKWNLYQGEINISLNTIQWTQFNQSVIYQNQCFFGKRIPLEVEMVKVSDFGIIITHV